MKTFKQYVDEAVGKFMTGEVGIKGKRVKVEVEVSGVDNKKRIYHAKVLAPKEHFGLELQIPAKVMHRGKWIKTETGKAFEAFISEGSRGEYTTKSYIFDKYLYPALILSPTALERVFGNLNKIKAWHVTEQYHIGELVKLQGKKSSISALTEINPSKSKPFEGMETDGGVVIEVEGLELLAAREDAWSELLDGGRRGVNIDPKYFPNLYKDMKVMLDQIADKYGKLISKYEDAEGDTWFEIYGGKFSNMSNYESEEAFEGIGDYLTQKDKSNFVKEYIDKCEEVLKKNKKGQEDLRQYGRMKSKKKDGSDYNEVVINQIKIKNVYLVKEMFHKDNVPFAIEDINDWWKGKVQMKTQKQLISLINKKRK